MLTKPTEHGTPVRESGSVDADNGTAASGAGRWDKLSHLPRIHVLVHDAAGGEVLPVGCDLHSTGSRYRWWRDALHHGA